jgi:hypothetical protein
MSVIVKASVYFLPHVRFHGVAGTKHGQHAAVLFARERVSNLTKDILLAVHAKPDVNVLLDMSETKPVIVYHGANVHHKTHVAPMSTTLTVVTRAMKPSVHVYKPTDMIAMHRHKDYHSNVLWHVKSDANVTLDMSEITM